MGYECDMNCFTCRFHDCMAAPIYILKMERKEAGTEDGKRLVRSYVRRNEVENERDENCY